MTEREPIRKYVDCKTCVKRNVCMYKKTFEEKEYANIALYLMKINDYSAIQLSGYDQNNQTSIYAWFINTGDNPVKIIMMTLKDDVNNYMFIPDSYKLEK